jgi:hypothetical protein
MSSNIIYKNFLIIVLLTLISCSTQEKAQIILNNDDSSLRKQDSSIDDAPIYPQAAEFKHYKLHEVLFTDTVASLAKRYNVSPYDIITLNKLTKPYYLEPGEVVKIPVYNSPDELSAELDSLNSPSVEGNMHKPDTLGNEPNKNTITILPSLPNSQLQDYDY